jgi:hypothetical protein
MSSTWTCGHTRCEKSGTKEDRTRIISVGRVRIYRSPLFGQTGDERTLPLSFSIGFHEKAFLVKVNVVTEAQTKA